METQQEISCAPIIKTIDTDYQDGFVKCQNCSWYHFLGNGFNQHHIEFCPSCESRLKIRNQRKVVFGKKNNLTAEIGDNYYFGLSNGIQVRFKTNIHSCHTGLSERKADKL